MKLVAVSGAARTGKSTIAQHLVTEYGFVELAFAAPIKAGIQAMLDVTDVQLAQRKELNVAPLDKSLRFLLQTLGTDWGRNIVDEDIWVKLLAADLDYWAGKPETQGIVISDVRFENEAEWVRWRGGVVVHLKRKGAEKVEDHSSEHGIAWKDTDYAIHNDFDREYLYTELKRLIDWDWSRP